MAILNSLTDKLKSSKKDDRIKVLENRLEILENVLLQLSIEIEEIDDEEDAHYTTLSSNDVKKTKKGAARFLGLDIDTLERNMYRYKIPVKNRNKKNPT